MENIFFEYFIENAEVCCGNNVKNEKTKIFEKNALTVM